MPLKLQARRRQVPQVYAKCLGDAGGTVGCIGGHIQARLYADDKVLAQAWQVRCSLQRSLYELCYCYLDDPTPAEAADAIDRFLSCKEPWP